MCLKLQNCLPKRFRNPRKPLRTQKGVEVDTLLNSQVHMYVPLHGVSAFAFSGLGPCVVDTQIARQTSLLGLFEGFSYVGLHR